jgi:hypothetical protein
VKVGQCNNNDALTSACFGDRIRTKIFGGIMPLFLDKIEREKTKKDSCVNKFTFVKHIKNMKILLINCSNNQAEHIYCMFDDPEPQEGQSSNSFSSCHNWEG